MTWWLGRMFWVERFEGGYVRIRSHGGHFPTPDRFVNGLSAGPSEDLLTPPVLIVDRGIGTHESLVFRANPQIFHRPQSGRARHDAHRGCESPRESEHPC